MALPTGFTASDTINSYSFAAPITLHDSNNMFERFKITN
jgi:hypothetical protein